MTAILALAAQHNSRANPIRYSILHRALRAFAETVPSHAKLMRGLAAQRLRWEPKSRISALVQRASCAELAAGSTHNSVEPFEWFCPTEPQATKAFVALLTGGIQSTRLSRGQALWIASTKAHYLEEGPHGFTSHLADFDCPPSIVPEHGMDDNKRVDIYLKGLMSGKPVELIIEAKFGHYLTPKQLSNYTIKSHADDEAHRILIVLAPRLTSQDANHILKENVQRRDHARWRFATWRQFMADFSSALSSEADDDEFRRVRRSLVDHAKKWE